MADPDKFPGPMGQFQVCVIGSGGDPAGDGDFPTDQSCTSKIYSPTDHGSGVSLDHLRFSPLSMSPTSFGQQSFPGVMDPGTPVLVLKTQGAAQGVVLGQINALQNPSQGGTGSVMGGDSTFSKLKQRKLGIKVPPEIKESTDDDGVKIRKIEEKGEEHRFELLEGLPIHGALFDMAGFRIPEISSIPTAKQTNDSMVTTDMLQGLMGQVMSMSQMFQGLMGNRQGGNQGGGGLGGGMSSGSQDTQLDTSLSYNTGNNRIDYIKSEYVRQNRPELAAAIDNLSILCQGYAAPDTGTAYFVNNVVEPNTYLYHAETLLLECETLDDLMTTLNRLQYDVSLYGHESLQSYEIVIDTAWGQATQIIDHTGEVTVNYSNTALDAMNVFYANTSSNTTSPGIGSSAPSGGGGSGGSGNQSGGGGGSSNMFGKSAQQMMEMMKRLSPQGEQNSKQMHEKLNTDQDSNKLFEIVKKTINGGNPLDPSLFQGQ